jgi:hypothetical protein
MKLSDLLFAIVGTIFIGVMLFLEYAGDVTAWLMHLQSAMPQAASSVGQAAQPNWLVQNWGIVLLSMVPIAWAIKQRMVAAAEQVETEDGEQATFASYRHIEVKVIR